MAKFRSMMVGPLSSPNWPTAQTLPDAEAATDVLGDEDAAPEVTEGAEAALKTDGADEPAPQEAAAEACRRP